MELPFAETREAGLCVRHPRQHIVMPPVRRASDEMGAPTQAQRGARPVPLQLHRLDCTLMGPPPSAATPQPSTQLETTGLRALTASPYPETLLLACEGSEKETLGINYHPGPQILQSLWGALGEGWLMYPGEASMQKLGRRE